MKNSLIKLRINLSSKIGRRRSFNSASLKNRDFLNAAPGGATSYQGKPQFTGENPVYQEKTQKPTAPPTVAPTAAPGGNKAYQDSETGE